MWGRPAATVYVRNSRYTLDFMNKDEYFTLSILPETYKSEMGYLGSHSGRDGNKYAKTDLHPISFGPAVGIQEAEYVFVMRKLYNARMDRRDFKDDVIYEEFKGTGNMELVLDRKLQEKRVFPAIDILKSGTRREDLLLSKEEQEAVESMRKGLNGLRQEEAVDNILNMFSRTKNNEELIQMVKKTKFI